MMRSFRRGWLSFALALLALAAASAQAQDPRASAAQAAARSWLAITDKGDIDASWLAAGKKFRDALDLTAWRDAHAQARAPLGQVQDRTMLATRFDTKFPGGPDGEYVQILFETNFATKNQARETVTLERERDGVWRVMGYLIR
jgi:uncharacterized protein DUF4019